MQIIYYHHNWLKWKGDVILIRRRETIEVVGMSKSLSNDAVEGTFCDILGKLVYNIAKDDLVACRWLKNKK